MQQSVKGIKSKTEVS